jgi:hypothetical protein
VIDTDEIPAQTTTTPPPPPPPPPPTTPPPVPTTPARAKATRNLIGELGTVTITITAAKDGEAEVRGALYAARTIDGTRIEVGEEIEVVEVEDGVLLVARPADAEPFSDEPPSP